MSEAKARDRVRDELARLFARSPLKLFATDVDGTLTDGGMYYTEAGEVMKRFDTRDAAGMNRLRRRGFTLAMVTTENSPIVLARARKLGIEHVYVGVEDKEQLMDELLARLALTWDQLCYVGDDLNDLPVIQKAGFSACPCDAMPEVTRHVSCICLRRGGHGAVREVCDLIEQAMGARV